MFRMGSLYHLCHVVDDINEVDEWFDSVFDALHVKHSSEPLAMRDATFVVIGDLLMEAMKVHESAEAEHSPLGRFRARYGPHLHSIAMFVDSMDDCADTLAEHDIRASDIGGRPIGATRPVPTQWMWTHPKDTRAVFEFAEMPRFHYDPRFHPSYTGRFWRLHPLGIQHTSHIAVVVSDLDLAREIYVDTFGGRILDSVTTPDGTRSAWYTLGPDLVIRATEPGESDSLERRELDRCGDGILGVTFRVSDLRQARDHLIARRQQTIDIDAQTIVLDPAHAFGMAIGFTTRSIPNDDRVVGAGVRS